MRQKRVFALAVVSCLIALIAAGCIQRGPDLVPERRPDGQGREGFCWRDENGNLQVRVRNQANEDVFVQTTTEVTFSPGGTQSKDTAPMPGGSMVDLTFEIPSGCFSADCGFTIKVDAGNDVAERSESNNTAQGICIG
jgi:hypothetical protein